MSKQHSSPVEFDVELMSMQLTRLWDALAWLASYDPMTVDDIEGEFQISVHNRTVGPLTVRKVKRGVRA